MLKRRHLSPDQGQGLFPSPPPTPCFECLSLLSIFTPFPLKLCEICECESCRNSCASRSFFFYILPRQGSTIVFLIWVTRWRAPADSLCCKGFRCFCAAAASAPALEFIPQKFLHPGLPAVPVYPLCRVRDHLPTPTLLNSQFLEQAPWMHKAPGLGLRAQGARRATASNPPTPAQRVFHARGTSFLQSL